MIKKKYIYTINILYYLTMIQFYLVSSDLSQTENVWCTV